MRRLYGIPQGAGAFTQGAMQGYDFADGAIRDRETDRQVALDREEIGLERAEERQKREQLRRIAAARAEDDPRGLVAAVPGQPAAVTNQVLAELPPVIRTETLADGSAPRAGGALPGLQHIGATAPAGSGALQSLGPVSRPPITAGTTDLGAPAQSGSPAASQPAAAAGAPAARRIVPAGLDLEGRMLRDTEAKLKVALSLGTPTGMAAATQLQTQRDELRTKVRERDLSRAEAAYRMTGSLEGIRGWYNAHVDDGAEFETMEKTTFTGADGKPIEAVRVAGRAHGTPFESTLPLADFQSMLQRARDPKMHAKWEADKALKAEEWKQKRAELDLAHHYKMKEAEAALNGKTIIASEDENVLVPDGQGGYRRIQTAVAPQKKTNPVPLSPGQVLVDPVSGAEIARGSDKTDSTAAKQTEKRADASEALALIDQAEALIGKATGSGFGALVDAGQAFVGESNAGAQAAAQLKALEGMLVAKMPKMTGPQSDKDVLLYKQMAGQIGDPAVPADTKRAAIRTIREIQQRQIQLAAAPTSDAGGAGKPTSTGAQTITIDGQTLQVRQRADGKRFVQRGGQWFEVQQ